MDTLCDIKSYDSQLIRPYDSEIFEHLGEKTYGETGLPGLPGVSLGEKIGFKRGTNSLNVK